MINIPNLLSGFRLISAFIALGLVSAGRHTAFTWLMAAMLISDWIDGKLAILLRQQTKFGARLDSVADALMYASLLWGLMWIHGDMVQRESAWVVAVVLSYAVTSISGWIKYGRLPSYHTRAAKTSWLLISLAALALFAYGVNWPLRVAAGAVVLTNLEATAITWLLSDWQADIPSLWHAWNRRQGATSSLANPHSEDLRH